MGGTLNIIYIPLQEALVEAHQRGFAGCELKEGGEERRVLVKLEGAPWSSPSKSPAPACVGIAKEDLDGI